MWTQFPDHIPLLELDMRECPQISIHLKKKFRKTINKTSQYGSKFYFKMNLFSDLNVSLCLPRIFFRLPVFSFWYRHDGTDGLEAEKKWIKTHCDLYCASAFFHHADTLVRIPSRIISDRETTLGGARVECSREGYFKTKQYNRDVWVLDYICSLRCWEDEDSGNPKIVYLNKELI